DPALGGAQIRILTADRSAPDTRKRVVVRRARIIVRPLPGGRRPRLDFARHKTTRRHIERGEPVAAETPHARDAHDPPRGRLEARSAGGERAPRPLRARSARAAGWPRAKRATRATFPRTLL